MIEDEISVLRTALVARLSPVCIYLFGSFAEGKGTDDSDLDFYIVMPDGIDDIAGVTAEAYTAIRHLKQRPVDIVVSTLSHFERHKKILSIEYEVYKKGNLIYSAADNNFEDA